jgi:hypothetical protein
MSRRRCAPDNNFLGRRSHVGIRTKLAASAAAALFIASLGGAAHAEEAGAEAKVKCEGVNSCKGHGECKSAANACKGQNGCGGKGFVMLTQAECDAAKAKAATQ